MSEGSEPGMCSNAGNGRATEAVPVDNATDTPKIPWEQASQQTKNDHASSSPHQRPAESEDLPSRQDLKDPEQTRNPELVKRAKAMVKDLRGHAEVGGSAKMQNSLLPKQRKQSGKRTEPVLANVFHDVKENDVLSCDVVAIYMASNQPGHDDGLSVFRRNPKHVSQPRKDGHSPTDNRQDPHRNSGTLSDVGSRKPTTDKGNTAQHLSTWLDDSDMLHRALPWSRIMSFGWNVVAQMRRNKQTLDLNAAASQILRMLLEKRTEEQRKRPIVFIGHGYGNVIVKKMLFEEIPAAKELEGDRDALVASTSAIIVFAPPFSNFDNLITWLHKTFRLSEKVTASEILSPKDIWRKFFSGIEKQKHDIATFGVFQTAAEGTLKKNTQEEIFKSLDSKWEVDADIEDIASFPSFDNEHFRNICKLISQSTAFHQLIKAGNKREISKIETLIDKMIDRSIDFDFQIGRRQPILHIAAGLDLKELVQCLVNKGVVALDEQDHEGNTALHVAVQKGALGIVEILMECGADSGIKNKTKESVRKLARKSKNVLPQIRELMKNPPLFKGPAERRELFKGRPRNEDARKACTETGITIWEIFAPPDKDSDEYRYKPSTIQKFIYEEGSTEGLFHDLPSPSSKEALCRWYHVPANNMAWDLFAKLEAEVWPWPSEFKRGRFHHGRYMNPEASRLEKLQKGSRQDSAHDWVIFMPYISYQGSNHQQKIASLIEKTSKEDSIQEFRLRDRIKIMRRIEEMESKGKGRVFEEQREEKGHKEREEEEKDGKQEIDESNEGRSGGEKTEEWHEHVTHDYVVGKSSQDDSHRDEVYPSQLVEDQSDGNVADREKSEGEGSNEEESGQDEADEDEADEDSAEGLTIKGYLNDRNKDGVDHLAFHIRRTLDQSYYYMLKDTSYRDKTQVVSRWAKRTWSKKSDHNVIMVDQLWLWFLKGSNGNPDTVITSFPSRQGAKFNQEHEASDWNTSSQRDNIERMILMDKKRDSIGHTTDLVSRILSVCCNSFNPHEHLEPVNFLQSFESTIGKLEEDESRLFRLFRERAKILRGLHDRHRFYLQDRSVLLKKLLDIRQESKLLKEVKDTLDEIKMIKSVLEHQIEVVGNLQNIVSDTNSPDANQMMENNHRPFERVLHLIRNTTRRFDTMESHAKEVEIELERLFDLKQKQANQWEARFSREVAEEASKQGSTVLIFTIVTIIFLPLSFMASFFALGISIFPKQDGENNFELSWVSVILFGVSFAVSVPFIIIALKIDFVADVWSKSKHSAAKYLAFKILKPYATKNNSRVRKWYGRAIRFIAKRDLPYDTKSEVEKKLYDMTWHDQSSSELEFSPMGEENEEYTDTEEELTDKDEQELKERQKERQQDLLDLIEDGF